ncbi:MAG: type secretion system protein (GspE), type pilus assembly protein PilB [Candidatus Doudnabacteria bacterium]|nr:type secretion system protein (GspE), type pilus assembly protein PilB [Candidatus Doudnabacteria bacterium]
MPEALKTDNFETYLIDQGLITQALYDKLKAQSVQTKDSVLNIITSQRIIPGETLAKAKAAFLNIPFISFMDKKVDLKVLNLIPQETYSFYKFFAFEHQGQNLKIAITDPTNISALEALEFLSKKLSYSIQLFVTDDDSYNKVMRQGKNVEKVVDAALANIEATEKIQKKAEKVEKPELQELIQDAPISKIVDVILTNAIDGNASDIHIEPNDKNLRIRYRQDGILHVALELPKTVQTAVVSKIKILSNLKIDESRLPQDGRFHYETESKSVDLRVSILPNVNGEKVVMRILDKSTKAPTLEQLGFRGKGLEWILENMKETHGIFLITGPTGSGKSTTLYSLLTMINTNLVNIITLEDPVEYFIPGVNQTQINPEIGLTFSTGLRSILRQDPNIIMVGEIRDKETAELAVQAALTGHLVFSTLHTNDAIGSLPRLIDMGMEPFLLAASMNVVEAQRLCRKICPDCKHEVPVIQQVKDDFTAALKGVNEKELDGLDLKNMKIYEGSGCEKCGNTGYKGRIAIIEVLQITDNVQNLILEKSSPQDIAAEAAKMGMITLQQDGIIKVLKGVTTYSEVVRVTSE